MQIVNFFIFYINRSRSEALKQVLRFTRLITIFNFLNHSELVEEDGQYGYGADEAYSKEVDPKERAAQCSPVGEFIFDDVFGCKPSDEQTGEEGTEWQ